MKLSKVVIENFRSIEEATIALRPRCRVLVGINESGKSNILKALSLLDPNVKISPEDLRESSHNQPPVSEGEVMFHFSLEEEDYNQVLDLLPGKILGDLNSPILTIDKKPLTVGQFV